VRELPLLCALLLLTGCGLVPVRKPHDTPASRAETQRWLGWIASKARHGDWLVIRGYHKGDALVAVSTNAVLTHAAILDLERGVVIEAVAPLVRVVPLAAFVAGADRLLVIHPTGWTADRGRAAVARAREQIGSSYDFLGTIGLPSRKRFYCTELAVWIYDIQVDRRGPHKVLHPRRLDRHGRLVLDTGKRKHK